MRATSDRHVRPVTSLSLQALEPRTPLAANVTTHATPAVTKLTRTPEATVRVHAVAAPRVTVEDAALAAAGRTATAAAEAARGAAVAARAGRAMADGIGARADSLAGVRDTFGIGGVAPGAERVSTGVPGLDLSVPGKGDGLAALREKYRGLIGGTPGVGGRAVGSSGGDDARAAAMAGRGKASSDDPVADDLQARSDEKAREANAEYDKGLEEERTAREYRRNAEQFNDPTDRKVADASAERAQCHYQLAVDRMREAVRLAERSAEHRNKPRTKNSERPAPDDRGTPPRRDTPPLPAPPPRPAAAARPAPDAQVVTGRPTGSVRGQVPTNPALDHGREYVAPRAAVPANAVTAAFARLGMAINPVNKR